MSRNNAFKVALRDLDLILIIAVILTLVINNDKVEQIYLLISIG